MCFMASCVGVQNPLVTAWIERLCRFGSIARCYKRQAMAFMLRAFVLIAYVAARRALFYIKHTHAL